jgi:4-methyl-5(b-hydroxyethyl)-thiazole monophosphate biosynthesis
MGTVYVFFADGFEEIEALTIVDVLRRAGINTEIVSVTDGEIVKGAHKVSIFCDRNFESCDFYDAEMLVLPGGMPGAETLSNDTRLAKLVKDFAAKGKKIAAICAAPMALGKFGVLNGYKATCYPGFQGYLTGAEYVDEAVVNDRNITTGRGPGAAMEFAFKLVETLAGADKVNELKDGMIVKNC